MSRTIDNKVLVIDVEATCWEPKESKPDNETSEIIEIGISVVDTKELSIIETNSIIVKPQRSTLSNFCTELTTLTPSIMDTGISFQNAVEILKKEYKSNNRTFISWGDYDRKMFEKNCQDYSVAYPFGPRHLNLKNLFSLFNGLNKELGLDAALNHLGLPLEGTHHRGNWDSLNISKILISMLKNFRNM